MFTLAAWLLLSAPPVVQLPAVSGRVTGEQGEPLPGVRVSAFTAEFDWHAETDADGRFELSPGRGAAARPGLLFEADGHSPQLLERWPREPVEVRMDRRTLLSGVVRDPDGRPLPGAAVAAKVYPLNGRPFDRVFLDLRAVTDAAGRYEMPALPGRCRVGAGKSGVGSAGRDLTVREGINAADLTLERGLSLRLWVVDSETGRPVRGLRFWQLGNDLVDAVTDEDGVADLAGLFDPGSREERGVLACEDADRPDRTRVGSLWVDPDAVPPELHGVGGEAVPPGLHWVGAERRRGALPLQELITLAARLDGEPVPLVLRRAAHVAGRVLDPDGRPVPGAVVSSADGVSTARTDADGRYELALPASDGTVLVAKDAQPDRRWANGRAELPTAPPGGTLTALDVRLTTPAVVRGVAENARGLIVRAVGVEPTDFDERTVVAADGTFELTHVPPGHYHIRLLGRRSHGAVPFFDSAEVTVEAGGVVEGVRLRRAESDPPENGRWGGSGFF